MSDENLIRFLLVEDDDRHAKLVIRCLQQNRVKNEVHRVSDGAEALAFLRREGAFEDAVEPDVILLDLNLPKLDGLEVLEQIKADERLTLIPVVMMTTSDAESDRIRAYKLSVNSYLVKPIDFARFQKMVDDLSFYWGIWNRRAR